MPSVSRKVRHGLFYMIVLMALELVKHKTMIVMSCAWYVKREATFSDVTTLVCRDIWIGKKHNNAICDGDSIYSESDLLETLLHVICYAA